jgi:feruloyl esterase
MKNRSLSVPTLWGTALGLAGSALLANSAFAASAAPACSSFAAVYDPSTMSYTGNAALAEQLNTAMGAFVLGIAPTEYPGGALNPAITEPVCEIGVAFSSNANPAQSYVNMAVMVPEADSNGNHWNGRFLGTGNGGFAGPLVANGTPSGAIEEIVLGVAEGYAAATNDMGTAQLFNCNTLFCGSKEGVKLYPDETPGGLYDDAAALTDFGYGATHLMTLAAKSLITTYYGQPPAHNYFHGCSTGGQQALMEAERFPTDYDGILAGSPAYDRTHLHIAAASFFETTHRAADAGLPNEAFALTHAAVLKHCAGMDGGLSTDNFLTQPAKCNFDATALQCSGSPTDVPCTDPTGTSCTCLTPDQAVSMNAAYSGAKDSEGRVLYPGYERGVEDPNAGVLAEEEGVSEPLFDSLDYWAFGPKFNWKSLFANTTSIQGELVGKINFLDNTAVGSSTMAGVLNANETNLTPFVANGGKLVMYAGYEDPLIPTASTLDYFNLVTTKNVNATSFSALFLAPGMWHCSGGPGANVFGNFNLPPEPTVPSDDILGALVNWRETGTAPTSIVATKYVNDDPTQGIAFQRPLCPYPQVAFYNAHKANPVLATSYTCETRGLVKNQPFAPKYGPVYTVK